jgi:hypothetical protein
MEKVTLSAPAQASPGTPIFEVFDLRLHRGVSYNGAVRSVDPLKSFISVIFIGENNLQQPAEWSGAVADALILGINKANCNPPNTMNARIIAQAIADGKLVGSASGSPD